jgi:DNA-binding ferritin-like protein
LEKCKRITEYKSELHSQREQLKKDMQAKDEIISNLKKRLDVQREEAKDAAMIKVRFAYTQATFPSLYYHQMLRSVGSTVKLTTSLFSLIHIT